MKKFVLVLAVVALGALVLAAPVMGKTEDGRCPPP
jgi:hypothetical protein